MLKPLPRFAYLFLAAILLLSAHSVVAQSPFIDQVPAASGTDENGEAIQLELKSVVRVVMRSKLGVVLRGDLVSISNEGAVIVTDRGRIRNPDGVEYKFDVMQSLNIGEHELHWSQGDDAETFVREVSAVEGIEFENLPEFLASLKTEDNGETDTPDSEGSEPTGEVSTGSTVIRMQPAKNQPIVRPTVTIICGNCEKEVSLSSDSGQECPHCHILWDSSPLDAAALADLKAAEDAADAQNARYGGGNTGTGYGESNTAVETGNQPLNQNGNPPVQNANLAPQPVTAPPPIQQVSQPQEITLENLPLWLKIAVFGVCFGIMYYAIFVR